MKKRTQGLIIGFVLGLMVVGLFWWGVEAFAGVVCFKDGSILEGKIIEGEGENEDKILLRQGKKLVYIEWEDVEGIFEDMEDLLEFRIEQLEKELEIVRVENERLEKDLDNKNEELSQLLWVCEEFIRTFHKLYEDDVRLRGFLGRMSYENQQIVTELEEFMKIAYRLLKD